VTESLNEDQPIALGSVFQHVETGVLYVVVKMKPLTIKENVWGMFGRTRCPKPATLARAYRRMR
jgi:hypothetical protein